MKTLLTIAALLGCLSFGEGFTKYGRTCKDIGCPSNQACVMESDPCSYYQRDGECGSYPTCKKTSGSTARSCSTFVCPPSQVCKMDGDTPKCVNDASKSGRVGYDTHAASAPLDTGGNAAGAPSPNLYPTIPRGETTPRPNIRPALSGGGYQGGQIGSGYPGQPSQGAGYAGYPQQGGSGYPQQGGYPQGGYAGYPQNGYRGGYPQGGYPQGGYNQGGYQQGQQYPGANQNGYNPYSQQYPQKSSGSSLTDKITSGLKSIGLFYILLRYFLARILQT